jgi:hypothetical protein
MHAKADLCPNCIYVCFCDCPATNMTCLPLPASTSSQSYPLLARPAGVMATSSVPLQCIHVLMKLWPSRADDFWSCGQAKTNKNLTDRYLTCTLQIATIPVQVTSTILWANFFLTRVNSKYVQQDAVMRSIWNFDQFKIQSGTLTNFYLKDNRRVNEGSS